MALAKYFSQLQDNSNGKNIGDTVHGWFSHILVQVPENTQWKDSETSKPQNYQEYTFFMGFLIAYFLQPINSSYFLFVW